jgi:hypothetical protein
MRNAAGWFCFVLLLGAVAGFAAGKWDAAAQTIDNKSTRFLAGTLAYGQATEAFVLFDTQTNRLVAYTIGGNRRLEVLAVREVSWDLKPVEWGRQEPTVKEMRDAFDKSEKERLEREKKAESEKK